MAASPQGRQWSLFVLGIGLVLVLLAVTSPSGVALVLGAVMVLAGLLGVLLG